MQSYLIIDNEQDFNSWLSTYLYSGVEVAFDTESYNLDWHSPLLLISLYNRMQYPVAIVPKSPPFPGGIPIEVLHKGLNKVFRAFKGVAHNAKHDLGVLKAWGFEDPVLYADTTQAINLVDSALLKKLETRVKQDLKVDKKTFEQVIGKKWAKINWVQDVKNGIITLDQFCQYACEDVFYTMQLWDRYKPLLEKTNSLKLLHSLENPMCYVLRDMHDNGIRIDLDVLSRYRKPLIASIEGLTEEIYGIAGAVFNLNSPKQVANILFDKLKLPVKKQTIAGARATDKYVMEALAEDGHKIAVLLKQHSALTTLLDGFFNSVPKFLYSDGKLRCDLKSDGAKTGRLSCSKPNLQNQPNSKEFPIRQAFVPDPGYLMAGADYSQIELRVMAHVAADEVLIKAFKDGEDIHAKVARDLGITRSGAKTINFAVLYGVGVEKLSRSLGVTEREAEKIINGYYTKYKGFTNWKYRTEQFVSENGWVKTIYGRRRLFPDAKNAYNKSAYYKALRGAVNSVVQGSAADLMKLAMIKVNKGIIERNYDAQLQLTVHDELISQARIDIVEEYYSFKVHTMENVAKLKVPLVADGKICYNWAQLKDDSFKSLVIKDRQDDLLTKISLGIITL